jgi:predicted transcriptional regulator
MFALEGQEYTLFGVEESVLTSSKFSLRRSHLEIRMDILSCVRAGIEKPTQIMYKANLSWSALKDHLSALLKSGLLNEVTYGNRRKFELTEKAHSVLAAYRKIVEDINSEARQSVSF